MFYYSDSQLDQWLMDDIALGDLTTRCMGIGSKPGRMAYSYRQTTRTSGVEVAARLLRKCGLNVEQLVEDGQDVEAGTTLILADGRADQLHSGWKVTQNIMEWSGGVATYMARMLEAARAVNPALHIACTRKSIPGTKTLANAAVVHGGGIIHRGGTAETILLFANHRCFTDSPADFAAHIAKLKSAAPEKKVIVEADTMDEAKEALKARPDVLQLDKFTPADIEAMVKMAADSAPGCLISMAGGLNKDNIADYARTGAHLAVTSAPYYAKPVDVKVRMEKR
ncbi:ModD protein [Desulfovibrio sp. OttesenSCG-928-C06]|nr:ModD protein [Desulfovibrio sp. OttesenSCG-928-C06]